MKIQFDKYQGAGNDFIILDNRPGKYSPITRFQITFLCNRFKGIGADGLIMINYNKSSDFQMQYFNSNGYESSFCGNGARCAVAFAHEKKMITSTTTFFAVDGFHAATYISPLEVHLKMNEVTEFIFEDNAIITDTGSPHYIKFVKDIDAVDVKKEGAAVRYSDVFMPAGINVNFIEKEDKTNFKIRTYERGVEDETMACGTGAVAAALGIHYSKQSGDANEINLTAPGGNLKVSFDVTEGKYHDIFLIGPANYVFSGTIEL